MDRAFYNFGNGLIDERTYDLQGRLTHQLLKTPAELLVDERSYAYDANSNLLDILTNHETNAYQYDALDRITEDAIDSDRPIDFTYDLNDNRLTKDLEDLSENRGYTYLPASNRIDAVEIFTAGSNPDPLLPDRELIYNDAGRLFQLLDEGILKAEYLYNDQGQRTRKTVYQADGVTIDTITLYHSDGDKTCFVSVFCYRVGPGLSAGAGGAIFVSISTSKLRTTEYFTHGFFAEIGGGGFASGSFDVGGEGISAGRGIAGSGGGGAAGYQNCKVTIICPEDPECTP